MSASRLWNGRGLTARSGIACTALLLVAGSCVFGSRFRPGAPPPLTGTEAVWTTPGNTALTILAAEGWQDDPSPLYTDDQRLHATETTFGDYVWIAPRPELDTMSTFGTGANGVKVAMLYVTPDVPGAQLPQTYRDLQLAEGLNCIYLLRNGDVASGFTKPANLAAPFCDNTHSNATPLPVTVVKHPAFPDPAQIPAVARFHEGKNATLGMENAPYFGMKCFDAWCAFIPASVTPRSPPQMTSGDEIVNQVRGWGDAQHLSIPEDQSPQSLIAATTPRPLKPSALSSWIVPNPNLKNWTKADYLAGFKHVATVRFASSPKYKYKERWHFEPHTENQVFIRAVDLASNRWEGYMIRRTWVLGIPMPWKRQYWINVTRDEHAGMIVPATARFRWDFLDEDLWIMCDDGCCRVSDGT